MKLHLFNSASRKKEPFRPLEDGKATLYTCGPTVYDYAHIGNFRTYLFEDLLKRTLLFFGYRVRHVMNITDVDDKTIKGAVSRGITLKEFTEPFIRAFFEDLETLKIQKADSYPAATEYISRMIEIIAALIEKGYAYRGGDGGVYYSIRRFERYGCLSHLQREELKAGASERVSSDEYDKEHLADFALWKAHDPERDGAIFWESPWGRGRPGWHIECSAMAMELLGETIDIHAGGVDNLFPHHENEIAQSEAYSGKRFANFWLHSEHLLVDNKKMSKKLNNFYTLRDLLAKGYTGRQVRYMLLQAHYKTQLNFTLTGLDAARESLRRINDFIARLQALKGGEERVELSSLAEAAKRRFKEALADDLNISSALASLFDLIREVNTLCDSSAIGERGAEETLNLLREMDAVLGVMEFDLSKVEEPEEVRELLKRREQARREKNWPLADRLRDEIRAAGYLVEDSPKGQRVKLAAK